MRKLQGQAWTLRSRAAPSLTHTHSLIHSLTVTQYLPIPSSESLLSLLLESAKGHCLEPGQKWPYHLFLENQVCKSQYQENTISY